jgi:hypothetical protein
VNFAWKSWLTISIERETAKSAGGEHVPPTSGADERAASFRKMHGDDVHATERVSRA